MSTVTVWRQLEIDTAEYLKAVVHKYGIALVIVGILFVVAILV